MGVDSQPQRNSQTDIPAQAGPQDMHLCREVVHPSLTQIAELIQKQPQAIEADLVAVDRDLVIPSVGEIDLIALSHGSLVLVSAFGRLTAEHLGKAAGIKQWVSENASVLRRVYAAYGIERSFSLRILFLCSELDPQAELLLSLLNDFSLEIFRYRCLASSDAKWLVVERIAIKKKQEVGAASIVLEPRKTIAPAMKTGAELTEEEINDFFGGEASSCNTGWLDPEMNEDDENTYSGPYFDS